MNAGDVIIDSTTAVVVTAWWYVFLRGGGILTDKITNKGGGYGSIGIGITGDHRVPLRCNTKFGSSVGGTPSLKKGESRCIECGALVIIKSCHWGPSIGWCALNQRNSLKLEVDRLRSICQPKRTLNEGGFMHLTGDKNDGGL